MERPRSYLKRFLSPALLAAVLEEQRQTKPGEIRTLDFAPLWASQDPAGVCVGITPGKRDGEVRVSLRYPGGTVELEFKMKVQGNQWVVDDTSGQVRTRLATSSAATRERDMARTSSPTTYSLRPPPTGPGRLDGSRVGTPWRTPGPSGREAAPPRSTPDSPHGH
jgi:hypothetical protein